MKKLNWDEFNNCIKSMGNFSIGKKFSGVYGFPRGGLCLAVALSHSLSIPFLSSPEPYSLVVDDIYETGKTLESIRSVPGVTAYVWYSKCTPTWWNSVEILNSKEWIIFPWENSLSANIDENNYRLSRKKYS